MIRLSWSGKQYFYKNNILSKCRSFNTTRKQHEKGTLKCLTEAHVKQYNDNGYTVVNGVLSKEEILEARNALKEFVERSRSWTDSDNVFELQAGHSADNPRVNRVRFPSTHHLVFKKLLHHQKMLDAVEDLLGPSFRHMPQDKLNVKPAGDGAAIRWHQDWAFFPYTNDSVLTVSVLLYDATRQNGCLQVVPKSHKGPVLSHFHNEKFVSTITDRNFKPEEISYLEAPAGSLTIHHVRAVHGSARNHSPTPRSVVCYIFNAMDAWPLLGVAGADFKNIGPVDFNSFNETIMRGEICKTPRLEKVPVVLPVPFEESTTVFDLQFDMDEPQP